jgi:Ca-activated chloride channel homolog
MQWAQPQMLHGLWLLPPLALLLAGLLRRRERQLARLLDPEVLARSLPPERRRRQRVRLLLWLAAWTLGVLALARPQWGEQWEPVRHEGLDIMVVLDTSHSMRAEDIRPNRLGRAQLGLRDLVGQLRGDRIGLIPFAGAQYLYCPLTADYAAFLMMLDDVHPGIVPRGGTAIEQALRGAIEALDQGGEADRVILLVTDGEDHEGHPLGLIDTLRHRGIRLFAVGVGSPEGELIPISDERGGTDFLRDREGQIVRTRLEESVLERLAVATGGMYVRATPRDFGLDTIYQEGIAPLQRALLETEEVLSYKDRYGWLLAVALCLWLLETVWGGWSHGRSGRSGRLAAGLALGLGLATPAGADSPRALMDRGVSAYEAGAYEQAEDFFHAAAQQAEGAGMDPARAHYNRANALHRLGRHDEAVQAYREALRSTDWDLQQSAYYNQGTAQLEQARALAEQQQPGPAKDQAEQALEQFRNALLLDPEDAAAKINYEWADRLREVLEELIAQSPPEPEPEPEAEENGENSGEPDPGEPGEEEGEDEKPSDPDEGEEDPASADPGGAQPEPAPARMDEMSEEEALRLLDALREEEQEMRDHIQLPLGEREPVEKDW